MNKYFRLNTYCYLEQGNNDGCIYNLHSGKMLVITPKCLDMLLMCEENKKLVDIPNIDMKFLDCLRDMDMGAYYNSPYYIDKDYVGLPPVLEKTLPHNRNIYTAYVELSTDCNFDCVFCEKENNVLFRKTGCKRWKNSGKPLNLEYWYSVIDQLFLVSCQEIVFIGGEPFLYFTYLRNICLYAIKAGIKRITIYTNCSIINADIIQFLKQYNIKLHIQLLGGNDATYQKVTGKSIHKIVMDNIMLLKKAEIPLSISYLINCYNDDDVDETITTLESIIAQKINKEFIYPIPVNKYYSNKYIKSMYDKKESFKYANLNIHSFCNAKKQHNCYAYSIGITADGNVIPCIMSRDFVLGNVKEKSLCEILIKSKYDYYTELNKDKINKCKSCSLRYGCFDCRALEYSATSDTLGMKYCDRK
ncbi:hypothetical protein K040078D81_44060 [Blautia hominis]|uniref:Radical SAM core domain-containing protein n=1 Tax=Blautia hominis TaxID=2025493 RepID=A0ABQ0BFT0_9FIRM